MHRYRALYQAEREKWQSTLRNVLAAHVRKVMTQGYSLIENYWSAAQCQQARRRIDACLSDPNCRSWQDPLKADQRVLGIDAYGPAVDLWSDPFLQGLMARLHAGKGLYGFTMGSRIRYQPGNLGSGQGWHRDSVIAPQYKAILYLSEVTPKTGPFQYVAKSGNFFSLAWHDFRGHFSVYKNRLTSEDVARFRSTALHTLCAPAGSLILVNTRGAHRGRPIGPGQERYALTNYYWTKPIPPHIDKLRNKRPGESLDAH